ncbi:hypothetical protein GCM10025794_34940 [Massilia kyonggiensis]
MESWSRALSMQTQKGKRSAVEHRNNRVHSNAGQWDTPDSCIHPGVCDTDR